jgi:hypothetical protein
MKLRWTDISTRREDENLLQVLIINPWATQLGRAKPRWEHNRPIE